MAADVIAGSDHHMTRAALTTMMEDVPYHAVGSLGKVPLYRFMYQ